MADSARPRAIDAGLRLGSLPPGPLDAIVDVPGVRVGHVSLVAGVAVRTGVTAIQSHPGDPFREKTPAAAFVLNGFGKTCGLPQVQELGVLETPVLLTGTLNVPRVADALIDWTLRHNPEVLSVNPVVGECNDGYLNDIRARPVRAEHVFAAIEGAGHGSGDFIIAFSNAETVPHRPPSTVLRRSVLAEDGPAISRLFQATVEAVVNALFRAQTVVGRDGHVRQALPLEPALAILRRYGQLA
jgi:L-aminopeptidase/D-esterase-like protein